MITYYDSNERMVNRTKNGTKFEMREKKMQKIFYIRNTNSTPFFLFSPVQFSCVCVCTVQGAPYFAYRISI